MDRLLQASKLLCFCFYYYILFQLQHAEEENASDVNHGRQPPRKQSLEAAELSANIGRAQDEFALILDNQINDDDFEEKLSAFLLHIGYLMGYNNRPAPTEDVSDDEIMEDVG